jgi:hypothetical protein
MAAQIINTLIGVWLMFAPQVFEYRGTAADNDHIVGPIITSFAIIALSGATRSVAKFNIPLGAWLMLAPLLLGYDNQLAVINDIASGVVVTICSFIRRKTSHTYGGGWRYLYEGHPPE